MKGTVALVVLAVAAIWAFLFLPIGKPTTPAAHKPAASAQGATPPPEPQAAVPQRAIPITPKAAATKAPAAATQAPAQAANTASSSTPSGRGDVRVIGSSQAPPGASGAAQQPRSTTQLAQSLDDSVENRKPTGELGEGILSPDYKLMEESYVQEARDGPWAVQQELRIRNLLLAANLGERIVLINCQSSVCRVHLEPHGQDPFGELLRVPGLASAMGIDSATPYSLNSAELIVYAKPEPIPQPAPAQR